MRRRWGIGKSEYAARLKGPIRVPGLEIQNPASRPGKPLAFGEVLLALTQAVFHALLLGDVAQNDGEHNFVARIQLRNGSLRREFVSLFSAAKDSATFRHRARNLRRFRKSFDVRPVRVHESFWQQKVERLADDFGGGIA